MTDDEQPEPTLAQRAVDALTTIRRRWRTAISAERDTRPPAAIRTDARPATEDEIDQDQPLDPATDGPRILAFWVHAMVEEWPAVLQHLEPASDRPGAKLVVVTDTIDCTDVPAMAALLTGEADRLAEWEQPGHHYGLTFVEDVEHLADAVNRATRLPDDRMTIGHCPACDRRVRAKAPEWVYVPNPTTDPKAYPDWEWRPAHDRTVTCRCGISDTIEGWHRIMDGDTDPLTAAELVVAIHSAFGLRHDKAIIRQWARRGLINRVGSSPVGEATYDRVQVFAALVDRQKRREQETA